jgi:putative DNA primase/helicase
MIALEHIPEPLPGLRCAVVWRRELRAGKWTKVPYTPQRPWRRASVTDPATWGTFPTAVAVVQAGRADGVGSTLGERRMGADLDHVRDPATGIIAPDAQAMVAVLDSYTEISPSGTGLRVLAFGALPPGRRRRGNIELYDNARFLTITGQHVAGTPSTLEERTAAFAALHREVFGPAGSSRPTASSGPREVAADDGELLAQARRARNGAKFDRLWHGDTTGYDSASQADLALCNMLAFWTRGDHSRVDRLFRASGLYRVKWDAKRGEQTYGAQTIACALAERR